MAERSQSDYADMVTPGSVSISLYPGAISTEILRAGWRTPQPVSVGREVVLIEVKGFDYTTSKSDGARRTKAMEWARDALQLALDQERLRSGAQVVSVGEKDIPR